MDEFLSNIFVWLRIPLVFLGFFIVGLFYHLNRKKEKEKVRKLQKAMEEEKEVWTTPLFFNAGFFVGGGLFLLGIIAILVAYSTIEKDGIFPMIVSPFLAFMGLMLIWQTSFIRIEKESIHIQPLLLKLIRLRILKKRIYYKDIQKVTKIHNMGKTNPFVSLRVHTRDTGKITLHTQFYNSEVGNALYEMLQKNTTDKIISTSNRF